MPDRKMVRMRNLSADQYIPAGTRGTVIATGIPHNGSDWVAVQWEGYGNAVARPEWLRPA